MAELPARTPEGPSPGSASGRGLLVFGLVASLVLGAVIGLSVWASHRSKEASVTPAINSFERHRPAWESAMEKVGVDALFPDAAVDVTRVRPVGRRPFQATLTAEEVTALMNAYRFSGEDGQLDFGEAVVAFPDAGSARFDVKITVDGTAYNARATVPLEFDVKGIHSTGITALSVEGFGVGGERKSQASVAVLAYLNSYVRAVPGLTVESARIERGALVVAGMAPVRIENP